MTKTVGIIGVGKMGVPLAANLIERGWRVLGYRRSSMDDFIAVGGEPVTSPAAMAARVNTAITILPSREALDDVMFDRRGLLEVAGAGFTVVEMSTLLQSDKQPALDALHAQGGDLLDCPISGLPQMIPSRSAVVFASGHPSTVERVRPVLDDIGPWRNVGEFGCGAKLKYVANLLVSVHNAVAAEAIVFAERVGLDPNVVFEAVTGTIASSTTFDKRVPMMLAGNWDEAPGPIGGMYDILEQIEMTGANADAPLPIFMTSKRIYEGAISKGWGAVDISGLFLHYRGDECPAIANVASASKATAS